MDNKPMKFKYYGKPDFNIIEVEPKYNKKLDMYYRPNTTDLAMIKECIKNYKSIIFKTSDIVMDLGANVGGFSKMALSSKVKTIIAFEPNKFNFDVLSCNVIGTNVELVQAAVVANEDDEITFIIKDNPNSACSGKVLLNGDKSNNLYFKETVKAVNFDKMLDKYRPNIIKMDIETGEYYILTKSLPDYVDTFAIELHGMNKIDYLKMYKMLSYLLKEWEVIYIDPVTIFDKMVLLNLVFKRKKYLNLNYDFSFFNNLKSKDIDTEEKLTYSEVSKFKNDIHGLISTLINIHQKLNIKYKY